MAAEGCGVGVLAGTMTHQLRGEVRRGCGPDGREMTVQTFRYVQADGSSGVILLCGCCGRIAGLRSEAVDLGSLLGCDACGAPQSPALCRAGHAFGTCPLCAGSDGVA